MNEDEQPRNIHYTFHVQSPEDFYNQLRAYEQLHGWIDSWVDENTDNSLAKTMLNSIGVRCE